MHSVPFNPAHLSRAVAAMLAMSLAYSYDVALSPLPEGLGRLYQWHYYLVVFALYCLTPMMILLGWCQFQYARSTGRRRHLALPVLLAAFAASVVVSCGHVLFEAFFGHILSSPNLDRALLPALGMLLTQREYAHYYWPELATSTLFIVVIIELVLAPWPRAHGSETPHHVPLTPLVPVPSQSTALALRPGSAVMTPRRGDLVRKS